MRVSGRHPGDVVRVVLSALLFGLTLMAVQRTRLTVFERDVFRLVNDLPAWMGPALVVVMQAGNVVAGPVTALMAVVRRSRRLAVDLAASGVLAWIAAKAVKDWIARPRPGGLVDDITRVAEDAGRGFVSGHTAVAVALATAASPYLPRRARRVAWGVALVVGLSRVYEGAHLPLDIVGGAAVGWFIASAIHACFGAPHRRPGISEVRAALDAAGFPAGVIRVVPGEAQGSFPFIVDTADERVFVKLLDPESRDRDLLYRLFRVLSFRDVRDEVALRDALAQADHEAAMTLLAREAGARVPAIKRVQVMGERVWVVEQWVEGVALQQLDADAISDEVLTDAWRQVALIHAGHLAHRDLVADNLLLGSDGRVWLVDFAHAMSSAHASAYDNDVAELLTSQALLVGHTRAVAAARRVLPEERLAAAAGELQPLALTAPNRRRLRAQRGLLARLRAAIETSLPDSTSTAAPALQRRSVVPAAAAVASMLLALAAGGPSQVIDSLSSGSWRWLAITALASASGALASAGALVFCTRRPLAIGRSTTAVLTARAAALAGGPRGRRDAVRRYLQLSGVRPVEVGEVQRRWRFLGVGVHARPPINLNATAAALMAVLFDCAALMAAFEVVGGNEPLALLAVAFVAATSLEIGVDAPAGLREALLLGLLLSFGMSASTVAAGVVVFAGLTLFVPAAAGAVVAILVREHARA